MSNQKPNGSVLKLAQAFQDVIIDAVKPLGDKIDGLETHIGTMESDIVEMKNRMGTYEGNIGAMFAQQKKDIAEQLKNR